VAEREEFRARLASEAIRAKADEVRGVLDQFNYELRQIDPLLEMVRAGETVSVESAMRPGYLPHHPVESGCSAFSDRH
jgi:hypothetical protein